LRARHATTYKFNFPISISVDPNSTFVAITEDEDNNDKEEEEEEEEEEEDYLTDDQYQCHERFDDYRHFQTNAQFWIEGVSLLVVGIFGVAGNVMTIVVLRRIDSNTTFNRLLMSLCE
jgi:hypothetical protein